MALITEDDYFTGLSLRKTHRIKTTIEQQERMIDLLHSFAEVMRSYVPRQAKTNEIAWKNVCDSIDTEFLSEFVHESMHLVQELNNQQVG